jgi:hypothetical protein
MLNPLGNHYLQLGLIYIDGRLCSQKPANFAYQKAKKNSITKVAFDDGAI